LKQAQSLATQLRLEQAAQINLMDLLLGDAKPFTPPNSALTDIFTAELKVGQPSDLLLQRPDIIAAEFRLKAANANIGAARAAFFPRISLNTAYGGISTELNGLFNSANRAWLFSPSISVPIFEGGRLKSNLELAEVRKNIAITNYEKTIQVAFREVADILAARQMLAEQVDIQVGVVDAQRERVRLAKLRYENGSSSYFEVLDAERDFLSAQQQLVVARFNLLTARAKLFSTLGGGYEANEDEIKISEDGINQK
jgi:multidrug efflux system outer membrane protein